MDELGKFIGDVIKHFPIFGIFLIIGIIYFVWYATGGVERGEARREAGTDGLFVEVKGVPDQFEEDEFFGVASERELEQVTQ